MEQVYNTSTQTPADFHMPICGAQVNYEHEVWCQGAHEEERNLKTKYPLPFAFWGLPVCATRAAASPHIGPTANAVTAIRWNLKMYIHHNSGTPNHKIEFQNMATDSGATKHTCSSETKQQSSETKQPLSTLRSISKRFLNAYYIVNFLVLSSYLVRVLVFGACLKLMEAESM